MKNINVAEIAKISRNISAVARTWPNDAESNRLARLSDKLLLLPKVKLDEQDREAIEFYLSIKKKSSK
jgi:hypothetical protein